MSARDPLRHVKPEVRGVSAYTLPERRAAVKLDQNENPYELPDALKARVLEAALSASWARYPAFDPALLRRRLAEHAGWRADGVLAGNGSNELIEALLRVTLGPGRRVVLPEPTFTLYGLLATVLGAERIAVPLAADLAYDVEALLRARRQSGAGVTIVCSPNNPTGSLLGVDEVARLCLEGDGLVVVDEAYHEFAGQTVAPLLAEHENLVVLRTFSKALALAGLRVGYLLASPALVREIDKARLPYNLNLVSQAAALAVLDEETLVRERVRHIVSGREALARSLSAVPGLRVHPSHANFLLVELAEAAPRRVFDALFACSVLVRDVSAYPRLGRCLRVSVGSPEENAALLAAFRRVMAPAPVGASS